MVSLGLNVWPAKYSTGVDQAYPGKTGRHQQPPCGFGGSRIRRREGFAPVRMIYGFSRGCDVEFWFGADSFSEDSGDWRLTVGCWLVARIAGPVSACGRVGTQVDFARYFPWPVLAVPQRTLPKQHGALWLTLGCNGHTDDSQTGMAASDPGMRFDADGVAARPATLAMGWDG